ncbi:MAG: polysaccharide lyase 6 family protein [Rikenellaceae bacterium]
MKTLKTTLASFMAVAALTLGALTCNASVNVSSIDALNSAVTKAKPGDTIVLAKGTYTDVAIKLKGKGTIDAPIVVIAESYGDVVISGKSSVKFGGEYLELNGLLFKDGYTTERNVVEFKLDGIISKGCRFTNNAIVSFNPPSKWTSYRWVSLSGNTNRVDHNSFVGKLNSDVVVAVDMSEEESVDPHHSIDHNYFGARQMLGSNGGETIRMGNSTVSMLPCHTTIDSNYFEECDGEVEVVSLKSCDNTVSNNVFRRCSGVLALRHGDRNIITGNMFDGDGKYATGGIRIIGADHVVTNNVFYKLRGVRFFAALGVMNAVPNSTPNRYLHVQNVDVKNNSWYDCANIDFGTGSDSERTLAPDDIRFQDNAIYGNGYRAYNFFSETDGYKFANNAVEEVSSEALAGFDNSKLKITDVEGIKVATSKNGKIGPQGITGFVKKHETGTSWYELQDLNTKILSGNVITIKLGQNTLADAVEKAVNGDVIVLSEAGTYLNNRSVNVDKYLVIKAAEGLESRPELRINGRGGPLVLLNNGADLDITGIAFNGEGFMGSGSANSAIGSATTMIKPVNLKVDDCAFYNFFSTTSSCIRFFKGSFANEVIVNGSIFYNCSSDAINLSNEKDDVGRYSAEYVEVTDCVFFRMMSGALNVYRGGNDESTSGPTVVVKNCTLVETENREQGAAIRLIGPQYIEIDGLSFVNSGAGGASVRLLDKRWDVISMKNINLWESGRIDVFWDLPIENVTNIDPKYKDIEAFDFSSSTVKVGAKQ